jgi:hypothetical protein
MKLKKIQLWTLEPIDFLIVHDAGITHTKLLVHWMPLT